MLEDHATNEETVATMGKMLSGDRRTKIYFAVFVMSTAFFILSLVVPENQYENIDMVLFAPSIIVLAASASGLSSRIKVLGERIQKPERVNVQSDFTISPDWSRIRSWPLYLLGLSLFAVEYAMSRLYSHSYFVGVISLFGLLFVALGVLFSFLKFMSR